MGGVVAPFVIMRECKDRPVCHSEVFAENRGNLTRTPVGDCHAYAFEIATSGYALLAMTGGRRLPRLTARNDRGEGRRLPRRAMPSSQ